MDYKRDEWKEREIKEELIALIHLKEQCSVETHQSTIPGFTLPANTVNLPIFEDFTKNHNKTYLQLTVGQGPPVEVIIRTRGKKDCDRPITATMPQTTTRAFQVEDFESLVVSNTGGTANSIGVTIIKTFCICCKDKKHHCDCD
ncbi:exosporium protein D [Peribacillus huizhouensis]|uniref:Exosporium protein D n=1 Tax=Peribacillus huizhouensis TaxID=1501239 RepID=A0ABR6CMP5_9BACI|nr:exosporium protein D [Peribacillus huizhouensis]MBA9026268.1 hypothetical protein [Peribacillus huizhouensis]